MSPQLLQRIMQLFLEDPEQHNADSLDLDFCKRLAKMGSSGTLSNNVFRDFKTILPQPRLPSLHKFMCPVFHKVAGHFNTAVSILLPHELFASIWLNFPYIW